MRRIMTLIATVLVLSVLAGCGWLYVQRSVETPDYDVLRQDGDIEIRAYPALLAAEHVTSGSREASVSRAFRPLANYIFAKDRGGEKVAMTAPVTQEKIAMTAPVTQEEGADGWKVRFLMPRAYTRATLPDPGPNVQIVEVPARKVAAIRFPGGMREPLYQEQEARLRDWMAANDVMPAGRTVFAYYNDPFTPGFLRRNEVQIPIE